VQNLLDVIRQGLEFPLHLVNNAGAVLDDVAFRAAGVHVLGVDNLLENGSECRLDVRIRELGIRRRISNGLLAKIVKGAGIPFVTRWKTYYPNLSVLRNVRSVL
jgi:hypothetical protein